MSAEFSTFINIGERTNVTGSARFKRLILEVIMKLHLMSQGSK